MEELPINKILQGNAYEILLSFPPESIDCVMFSPPYWTLRDFKTEPIQIKEWKGQLGLETNPQLYIDHIVYLCSLLSRVLKKTGSLWLNLGDTYFGHWGGGPDKFEREAQNKTWKDKSERLLTKPHHATKYDNAWLQPKQKLMIPERIAIQLQEQGWILRNNIIWYKPNHMPSSVRDRLTNAYEYIYHFVKNRKYYYDLDSIREPFKEITIKRCLYPYNSKKAQTVQYTIDSDSQRKFAEKIKQSFNYRVRDAERKFEKCPQFKASKEEIKKYKSKYKNNNEQLELFGSPRAREQLRMNKIKKGYLISGHVGGVSGTLYPKEHQGNILGKNPGDVWIISTKPCKEAHFAVYPEELCIRPIKATCPKDGIVLDPLCGTGTTCLVAAKLGGNFIGIELNPEYVKIANKRLAPYVNKLDKYIKSDI